MSTTAAAHVGGHRRKQAASPGPTARATTPNELLRTYQRCAACARARPRGADHTESTKRLDTGEHLSGQQSHPHPPTRQLLAALADLFGSRVFPRYATASPNHGQVDTCNAGNQLPADLASLPLGLLQHLLDAFRLEIHLQPHQRHARIHITISALTATLTVHHLTGPEADHLAHAQYVAIMEVLQWLHDHPAR
ncbi:MAG: hypothetical protein GEV12_12205 [Micromonosporaceae bacterium]|nr:hypothetical protein [Micromonosporaceae bacterium]